MRSFMDIGGIGIIGASWKGVTFHRGLYILLLVVKPRTWRVRCAVGYYVVRELLQHLPKAAWYWLGHHRCCGDCRLVEVKVRYV